MKPKDFAQLVARDHACLHCGETEAIAPNHRINRQMGGASKNSPRHRSSNLVLICSSLNGLIESDHRWAEMAKHYGYKLESWQNPLEVPVFDFNTSEWRLLDDAFSYTVVKQERESNATNSRPSRF